MTGGMWDHSSALRPEDPVRLDVAGVGPLDAHVVRAVPGAAELVLPDAPTALPARYLAGRTCRVADGGGLLVAARRPDGSVRDDVVHLVLDPIASAAPRHVAGVAAYGAVRPHAPETQRRAHERVALVRPVLLVPQRTGNGWLDAQTRDLSPGGALLTGTADLRTGDRLRLLLELGPGALVDSSGRVVRVGPDGQAAVSLDQLTTRDRTTLARYLAARKAAALAELRATG